MKTVVEKRLAALFSIPSQLILEFVAKHGAESVIIVPISTVEATCNYL